MTAVPDTRQKLMQVATDLISESNYEKVGIAEICKQAGVTKGAFYHHFKSKADLFASASSNEWEAIRPRMDAIFSPSRSALQQLESYIELTLEKQRRRLMGDKGMCSCPFFTAGAQAACGEDDIRQVAQDASDNNARYHRILVRNLASEGYLSGPVDEEQAGRMIQDFVQGLLMHARVHQDFDKFERDLREGVYRLLELRPEYRVVRPQTAAASEHATVS